MRIFGAQEIDRVLLLGDEMARLHQLLGGVDRAVLDAIDVSSRPDQRGDGESVQDTPHLFLSPPPPRQSPQPLNSLVPPPRRRARADAKSKFGGARARVV